MQQTNLSTTAADDNTGARLMAAMQAFMAADFVDDIAFAAAQESAMQEPLAAAHRNANQNTDRYAADQYAADRYAQARRAA